MSYAAFAFPSGRLTVRVGRRAVLEDFAENAYTSVRDEIFGNFRNGGVATAMTFMKRAELER